MLPEHLADRRSPAGGDRSEWARLTWNGDRLARLEVASPCGRQTAAIVHGELVHDPLLGDAHVIETPAGRTRMSAIAWARPTRIPTIAHPGRLPGGAGAAILNAIARLAEHADVTALRYAGPYPTPALWRALARSYRTTGTEAAFTADLGERMATLARTELPIDFVPAPHERLAIAGGVVERRDAIERVLLDGVAYEHGGSPARLVTPPGPSPEAFDRVRAEVWFGDTCYAHTATLSDDGTLLDQHPLPTCDSTVIGRTFPPELAGALAELVAELVPPPLAALARDHVASHDIRWADLGARAASRDGETVLVHAALWDRVAPHGMARLALALAEAIAPVVTIAALAGLTDATVPA